MSKPLRLKKDIPDYIKEQATSDFWYDLFDGGYIVPKDYVTEEDAKKVQEASKILLEFRALLEDNDLIGEM